MNKIFTVDGPGWSDFPRRSFGRLDQREPLDLTDASEAVFAFDVVDAEWNEFRPAGSFDLLDAAGIKLRQARFWGAEFDKPGRSGRADPYDNAPIYRVEISARRGDPFFDQLADIEEAEWSTLELDSTGAFEVDVYGGLFQAPVQAHLRSISTTDGRSEALTAAFGMDVWPDADATDIADALKNIGSLDYLVAFDIGQGSANGLADVGETVRAFFDLGCGVYGNRATRPVPLRFCWRVSPPIILSHWDTDHWAGEISDPAAAGRVWLAPRQVIGPTHVAFARRIHAAHGTLLIWGAAPAAVTIALSMRQSLCLARCSGASRNGSGISAVVSDISGSLGWLLTGDAGYHELNQPKLPSALSAVVVPHHGADMGGRSVPPVPPTGYARLIYSFGPANKHGRTRVRHPTPRGVNAHVAAGWNHAHWITATPATHVAGGHVLATASHPGTHLHGAVAAWAGAPHVPFASVPCAGVPAGPHGCTGQVSQA